MPTSIRGYDPMWMTLAFRLNEVDNLTLPIGNVKQAKSMRLRFYGFRRAMMNHDATNPMIANMMQTQVTITEEGNLHFERNPFGEVLRGLLEHSIVKEAPKVEEPAPDSTLVEGQGQLHEQTILNILTHKK
jgi:hypothetical protein